MFHAHGCADDGRVPVLLQPVDDAGVVELLTAPAVVAPEEAVAGEADRLAVLVDDAVAGDGEGAMLLHRLRVQQARQQ